MQKITLTAEQMQILNAVDHMVEFVDAENRPQGTFERTNHGRRITRELDPVTKEELDEIRRNGKVYTSEEFMAMVRSHCR